MGVGAALGSGSRGQELDLSPLKPVPFQARVHGLLFCLLRKLKTIPQPQTFPGLGTHNGIQSDPQLRKKPHHVNTFITGRAVFEILKDILFLPLCHF